MINGLEDVTAEWLTELFLANGSLHQGRVVSARIAADSSYSSVIGRLTLTWSSDTAPKMPSRLFIKVCRSGQDDRVVGNERRHNEVRFHNEVASRMPNPPIVPCYRAVYHEQTGSSYLLFDDISETHFQITSSSPPSLEQAGQVIDSFAGIHSFWWDHQELSSIYPLPTRETSMKQVNSARECYPRFADFLGSRLSTTERDLFEYTLARLAKLADRTVQNCNRTLIHGDPNWGNVLLPHDVNTGKAIIIDWQLVRVGYATEDLAFLIALFWRRETRKSMEQELIRRYHHELLRQGGINYSWDECWNDYRRAILSNIFTPMWFWETGSSESWWEPCLRNITQACEDLNCLELLDK